MNDSTQQAANHAQDINDNRDNWNDRAAVHAQGGYGDIDGFIADPDAITDVTRRDMAVLAPHLPNHSLQGRKLLHLQCHIGTDTLSWARLGAQEVWGLDFSPASLSYARDIARRAGKDIHFVESDARYAARAMPWQRGGFDVVVTSVGTITWLPDLKDWAQSIADLLAPGGVFMIRDTHPLLFALDNAGLNIIQDYFSGTEVSYESDSSYTEGSEGTIAHSHNHNWAHDFEDVTGNLLNAGLEIAAIGEHDVTDWRALPMLEFSEDDEGWHMPKGMPNIPLNFSIVARKR
ncbi:class I SAM-dependent methyltransferase [Bifidobacterium psychraerophilum]|jgi:SAM-dependent methyltransferase|uniref:Methyltransferase n=1 Tax=Bifidobacterium psychraerophilum TaxID=218140 RepID=A0A087CGV3_9BIFI|nr:class I SAM-dependent methyltransferase [Bifidobacterium psychraerophilum]KFI82503.1 methyltransferase [Bifidobacterium psychraerophilum]PKA95303.1 methyltransferase family protein [Bifidobacterium psychraerophilum DSM 22366]